VAGRVEFDILARDHASGTLARIGQAFRKISKDADDSGKKTGQGFGSGFQKWFSGSGVGLLGQLGRGGGSVFGSGILGALRTPVLGPLLIGAVGAAAAVAMPVVGAIAATGLVTAFGAGLAGLGIVFAAKSQAVKDAWSSTLDGMSEEMTRLSEPFEDTLIAMAGFAKRTFDAFAPALGKAFEKMAGPIETFADQAARAFESLIPAIAPLTDGFNAVLRSLGPALQTSISNISTGLANLGRNVAANPQALSDMVTAVGSLSRSLIDLTAGLNSIYGGMRNITGAVSGATGGLVTVGGVFNSFKNSVNPLGGLLNTAKQGIMAVGGASDSAGASMLAAADAVTRNAQAMQAQGAAASGVVNPNKAVSDALIRQKAGFTSAIAAMGQWSSAAIANSNAAVAYQAAIDDASASVKENGKTLDINTAKGRANKTALIQVAQTANTVVEGMDAAGASNVAVAKTAEASRANFIKLARQMGATKPQAEAMAESMLNIPNVSREAKLTANKKDLEAKLASAKRQLADKNLTKERKAQIKANIAQLEAALRQARGQLASLPSSKTVTIHSRFITERIIRTQTTAVTGGHAPTHASGGVAHGWSWVGERGPELAHFPAPTRITPAGESARVMRGAQQVNLSVSAPTNAAESFIVEMLRRFVKVNGGGNVQRALGP